MMIVVCGGIQEKIIKYKFHRNCHNNIKFTGILYTVL